MEESSVETIRETPLGQFIGCKLLDITAIDKDEFLETGDGRIFFHFDNGETMFVVMKDQTIGIAGDDEPDEEEA